MSMDIKNLKKLLQNCKKVNCEYIRKHNELKEVVKNYEKLAKEVNNFELFNSNIVDILNNSNFLDNEKMEIMKEEQNKIMNNFRDLRDTVEKQANENIDKVIKMDEKIEEDKE